MIAFSPCVFTHISSLVVNMSLRPGHRPGERNGCNPAPVYLEHECSYRLLRTASPQRSQQEMMSWAAVGETLCGLPARTAEKLSSVKPCIAGGYCTGAGLVHDRLYLLQEGL